MREILINKLNVFKIWLCIYLFFSISCFSQDLPDSVSKKESFLLSLFPEDCRAIYHLSGNNPLRGRLDSLRSKFNVFCITVRKKPGIATAIFEKLSESLLPDSLKYILFKVEFAYTGKNLPYKVSSIGSLNCDTLKSTFTLPLIQSISGNFLNPVLEKNSFSQPIGESAASEFNSAIFPSIDTLLSIYNNDRIQNLAFLIDKYLIKEQDSLNEERGRLKVKFSFARKRLLELIRMDGFDSIIYLGNQGKYMQEGMSELFEIQEDMMHSSDLSTSDLQIDSLLKFDKLIMHLYKVLENINFIRNTVLYAFSHKIKSEIEKKHVEVDDILSSEENPLLHKLLRYYYESFDNKQLKQIFSDKS